MNMKTIARNRKKYIDSIFYRPTQCGWITPTAKEFSRDVSPHFAKKEFEENEHAKIRSYENGRFEVIINQNSWFEITNMGLFQ